MEREVPQVEGAQPKIDVPLVVVNMPRIPAGEIQTAMEARAKFINAGTDILTERAARMGKSTTGVSPSIPASSASAAREGPREPATVGFVAGARAA